MNKVALSLNAGSAAYWEELREGWALLREARRLFKVAKLCPLYIADADGEPQENTGPTDAAHDAEAAFFAHPAGARIARAQGLTFGSLIQSK
ncbi:hypothetical protein SDC9_69797 [bioreactor metagenome]|uniref:Uncharacterized protein n=1 Tax=bioreactor metagenome TaxID=1076179 RepID=A0A644Y462_9ZZZZ